MSGHLAPETLQHRCCRTYFERLVQRLSRSIENNGQDEVGIGLLASTRLQDRLVRAKSGSSLLLGCGVQAMV